MGIEVNENRALLSPHIDSSWPANFDLPNVRLYQSVVFEELDQLNFCSGKGHIANQHKSFTALSVNMFFEYNLHHTLLEENRSIHA